MPTLNLSLKDMETLLSRRLPKSIEELNEILQYAKGEAEEINGDELTLTIEDSNRPDLWCAEGIARELRGALKIETGLKQYKIKPSGRTLTVDKALKNVRPLIAAAIIKNIRVDEALLLQLIQLQEKVCMTFGRNRKAAAMGVYDCDKVHGDIRYIAADPKLQFTPLEFNEDINLNQILQRHPKGREYAHLLEGFDKYPIVIDSKNNVLSMPPIINSNYSGKVTEDTKNIFIEVTGHNFKTIHTALLIAVSAFADRGGIIESVKVKYPDKTIITPDFTPSTWKVKVSDINSRLGLNLSGKQALELLKRARYDGKVKRDFLELKVPAYRVDIMHDVDIIEDVAIMYGYANLKPQELNLATLGGLDESTKIANKARELAIGFGAQEVQTFTLTSRNILEKNINSESDLVEITNPMSQNYAVLRDKIWPGLLDFLSKNTNVEYPQLIFEVGDVVIPNPKAETRSDTKKRLAFAIAKNDANFTEAKQVCEAILRSLNKENKFSEVEHGAFITGRVAKVGEGLVGEIHPSVLEKYGIEVPVTVFEVEL